MKLISCSWGRHGGNSGHGEGEIEVARGCEARAVGGGHRCGGGKEWYVRRHGRLCTGTVAGKMFVSSWR